MRFFKYKNNGYEFIINIDQIALINISTNCLWLTGTSFKNKTAIVIEPKAMARLIEYIDSLVAP